MKHPGTSAEQYNRGQVAAFKAFTQGKCGVFKNPKTSFEIGYNNSVHMSLMAVKQYNYLKRLFRSD